MAEGARLESVYTLTGIVGSNPTLSAIPFIINNLECCDTIRDTKNTEVCQLESHRQPNQAR